MAAHSRPAGQDIFARFHPLFSLVPEEVVAHTLATDVVLPDGRTLVLLTLDNRPASDAGNSPGKGPARGTEQDRPTTLGPATLVGFGRALQAQRGRAAAGEIAALAVTGKPRFLAAGADLSAVANLRDPEHCRLMAELGHAAYGLLADLGVPTFAFINGVALGGGLELALACTYRTVSDAATQIGLPEAFLGLVPGWGGVHRLPRLVGPEAALRMMLQEPLTTNRSLDGPAAYRLGIADALFGSADFLERSIAWAASVLDGTTPVERPHAVDPADPAVAARWAAAAGAARAFVEEKTSHAAPAPARVIELFEAGRTLTSAESAQLECQTLAELMQSPQFRDAVYAFLELVHRRSRRPAGAPGRHLARPVEKVGVIGAGLMAGQLALLFATALEIPVLLTDVDQARLDGGLARIHAHLGALEAKGRLSPEAARRTRALVSGSVQKEGFADAGLVVEAVFEDLAVKRRVFAELEAVVSPGCVLATNTSSLPVAALASGLAHPERVVGFHFFNPVAAMPLVEIVRTPLTSEAALATAFALAGKLGKTAVLVKDSPGFVVNRILLRLLGEVQNAFDDGTSAEVADGALRPLGLPLSPFTLMEMVGLPVVLEVARSLQAAYGDRFRVSANLQALVDAGVSGLWESGGTGVRALPASTLALLSFGGNPSTAEQLLARTQDALAGEIGLMLAEGVVAGPEEIDLCMILGAGWPMHLGGITPYLDRVGASERVNGRRFHPRR